MKHLVHHNLINKNVTPYLRVNDHLVSQEQFDLLHDVELDMLVTSPQPNQKDLPRYYDSDTYISHTDSKKGLVPFLYQQVKKHALRKKLRLINRLNQGAGQLADLGAGTGGFLEIAKREGWEVSGVEPDHGARELALRKGLELQESIASLCGKQFDVVTLWHVLEHLPDLEEQIKIIMGLVRPGGHLVVAVPNWRSFDARYYKTFWAAYDVPRHLWHFSKNSLEPLFSESMDLGMVRPMVFDSYYVSLLSEKYRSGKTFSFKALMVGLWSNAGYK